MNANHRSSKVIERHLLFNPQQHVIACAAFVIAQIMIERNLGDVSTLK